MTIVFLLWIEIHRNSHSNRSFECIKELTTAVVFEIFDSIDLLDLLIPMSTKDEQKMDSPHAEPLSIAVLVLSTINLLLPTIGLFRLSQKRFDSHRFGLRSNIVHNSLRILFINIPFMALRVTYWSAFEKEISIFLLKNALFLFVSLRHIISEAHELRKLKQVLDQCCHSSRIWFCYRPTETFNEFVASSVCVGPPPLPIDDGLIYGLSSDIKYFSVWIDIFL